MSNKILKILALCFLLLIILVIVAKKQNWIQTDTVTKVAVEKIENRTIIEQVSTNGKIYPSKEVKLSVEVSGEVSEIHVVEGDSVRKGDLLLAVNPSTYTTSVSRAKASYNQALSNYSSAMARNSTAKAQYIIVEKDYKRKQNLLSNKVISASEFDAVESRYYTALGEKEAASQNVQAAKYSVESALASFNEAKELLGKTKLYAPMSGIVSKLNVELGEKVVGTAQMIGTELISIADLNNMELQVEVGENDVLRISEGDTAQIIVDAYLAENFLGIVTHIAYSSKQNLTDQITKFQVKIKVLSSSYQHLIDVKKDKKYPFRPGLSATADIQTNRKVNVPAVPIQSVTKREDSDGKNQRQVLFVVADGIVKELLVETGLQDQEYIEVKSEIADGIEVVSAPFKAISKELEDSLKVEVVSKENLFKEQ